MIKDGFWDILFHYFRFSDTSFSLPKMLLEEVLWTRRVARGMSKGSPAQLVPHQDIWLKVHQSRGSMGITEVNIGHFEEPLAWDHLKSSTMTIQFIGRSLWVWDRPKPTTYGNWTSTPVWCEQDIAGPSFALPRTQASWVISLAPVGQICDISLTPLGARSNSSRPDEGRFDGLEMCATDLMNFILVIFGE